MTERPKLWQMGSSAEAHSHQLTWPTSNIQGIVILCGALVMPCLDQVHKSLTVLRPITVVACSKVGRRKGERASEPSIYLKLARDCEKE
jgi:hypothetical protein